MVSVLSWLSVQVSRWECMRARCKPFHYPTSWQSKLLTCSSTNTSSISSYWDVNWSPTASITFELHTPVTTPFNSTSMCLLISSIWTRTVRTCFFLGLEFHPTIMVNKIRLFGSLTYRIQSPSLIQVRMSSSPYQTTPWRNTPSRKPTSLQPFRNSKTLIIRHFV